MIKTECHYDEAIQLFGYKKLQTYVEEGIFTIQYRVKSKESKRFKTIFKPVDRETLLEAMIDLPKHALRQQEIIQFFIDHPKPIEQSELFQQLNITRQNLRPLFEKNLIEEEKVEVYRNPYEGEFEKTEHLSLTEEQQQAIEPIIDTIDHEEHRTFLLHGVTGSGKTEIYLQAIDQVIQRGKEAIVLVPEISLTPQMVKRFKGRFGSNVAVLHSGLSIGEKYDEWRKMLRKEVQVVVGARSAIFAPFENLGIIIIDEEHETTYKQEETPRYHARDVAIKRGEYNRCPVVLGSATPSLESYARGVKGVYHLLTMKKRTNEKAMPAVEVIDMRDELHAGNRTMFSRFYR